MIEQCADKGLELQPYIEEMVRAAQDLEKAKRKRDKGASRRAEKELQQAAHKVIKIEPTVAHLYMKACHPVLESYIREAWISNMPKMDNSLASVFFSSLFTLPNLENLLAYSFALQFTFRLRKPYLSRDDTDWHILDNPVNKEKVFGLPMVAPTGWKGALRAAMRQEKEYATLKEERGDQQMMRLFGNVTDETREDAFRSGRLRFYPTFFTQTGLEVINPHPRESGAGKQPIYFECVPIGAQGTFTLLYVPFDLIGKPEDKARNELANDLMTVGEGVRRMLAVHGFGAKTSSGFGVTDHQVTDGRLTIRTEAEPLPFPFDSLPALSALADAAAEQLRPGGAQ
jgi:CRISPR-associated protein Cmr2